MEALYDIILESVDNKASDFGYQAGMFISPDQHNFLREVGSYIKTKNLNENDVKVEFKSGSPLYISENIAEIVQAYMETLNESKLESFTKEMQENFDDFDNAIEVNKVMEPEEEKEASHYDKAQHHIGAAHYHKIMFHHIKKDLEKVQNDLDEVEMKDKRTRLEKHSKSFAHHSAKAYEHAALHNASLDKDGKNKEIKIPEVIK